jgi:coenzyme F420-reducing hydrogenase delta subunit
LGTLNQRHENLKDEVDKLKKESEKPKGFEPTVVQSGADLEKIFHDIKNMKKAIEELKHNLELVIYNS